MNVNLGLGTHGDTKKAIPFQLPASASGDYLNYIYRQ